MNADYTQTSASPAIIALQGMADSTSAHLGSRGGVDPGASAGWRLELQPERAAEERCDWGHLAASGDKERHELRARDLSFSELHSRTKIAKLQVFHELMVSGEATRRTAKLGGVVPVEQFTD